MTAASLPAYAQAQAHAKRIEDPDAPTTLEAEQVSGRPDREIVLQRDVVIIRGETTVNADSATYHIVEDEIEAKGNVRMKRFGDQYTGDEVKLQMDVGQGYVTNPTYRLQLNNAQGKAERIDFEAQDRARVIEGTYSTCEGPDPDWYLRSSTISLDRGRDIGTSTNSIVYFKGVPILGTPFMSFPLSDARKSGILPPSIGTTNTGGLELLVPYYFNIAPNRDLTLYPRIMSKRGFQLGMEGRYLGDGYSGQTKAEGLLNDRQANRKRYAISSVHAQTLRPGLTFASDINAASDDDYPNDFPGTITTASQRLLLRDMNLAYAGSHWGAGARVSNYQVLQDPRAPIARPYDRLPQLTATAGRQDVRGFDWSVISDFTRFWHPTNLRGDRFVVNPRVSYPIVRAGYFLTPSLSMHASTYSLVNPAVGSPSSFSRILPTFSVDSGLIFERDTGFLGAPATQTLEPRLFYVRTPFRDQSAFPIFDSGLADFNFSQIFSENRFSGQDRISDANQLTAAVVSRYIAESGIERLRVAMAQRYYFTEQLVTAAPNETRSDLLLAVSGRVSSTVNIDANMQYSQSLRATSRANYGLSWRPAPKKVLNLQYRRDLLNNLEQMDVSAQWPIAQRWYGVGRVNYSIPDRKVAESLLGLEYKADCWIFRMVTQRLPTATSVAATTLFFQLELNGLSAIGSNPLPALKQNISGYQPLNQ